MPAKTPKTLPQPAVEVSPAAPAEPPAVADPKQRLNTLIVVKRTEQDFVDWVSREPGFLTTCGSFGDEPIKLEPYQLAFLSCDDPFRCVEKSRRVGYSWIFSCEAFARAHLRDQYAGIFVSYNLSDAKEKIAYVQQLHEELPLEYQKKKVTDSKLELAFQSNGASKKISRIISNPSKAPRGKGGDIYLDELAHCQNDEEIYAGSTALILRAQGAQFTVCSSPLGRRGVFWGVARQEVRQYRNYWRQAVPWWLCGFMCTDIVRASRTAAGMTTEERIARFGTTKIKDQFEALMLEDFQQEFECFYSDETLTFYPYDLIIPCTEPEFELCSDYAEVRARAKGRIVAAFDVGRKRDLSELTIFDENDATGEMTMLLMKTFDRSPFRVQEDDLRAMLTILPVARFSIDNTGLGMNLAENLETDYPGVVIREDFTSASKEVWCNDFKIKLQKKLVKMPRDRDLIAQIHSIKKNVTVGGRVTFDAERDAKGHADKFWSCALACRKERGELPAPPGGIRVRVFG